jgi:hypothetical protein
VAGHALVQQRVGVMGRHATSVGRGADRGNAFTPR